MSTSHATNTAQGSSRLLSLPAELRNSIYEYVLADVQDNVCIDLEREDKKIHQVSGTNPSPIPDPDNTSRLSLLLTCKTINAEASGIAFSNMSMKIATVFPLTQYTDSRSRLSLTDGGERLSVILDEVNKTFLGAHLGAVPTMVFPSTEIIFELIKCNNRMVDTKRAACTANCALYSHYQGVIHNLFHNVRRIVVGGEEGPFGQYYLNLPEGGSWLSITMEPSDVKAVLNVFSNLEEIVVRREIGEQVSKVINGKVYAAESDVEMLGMDDWAYHIVVR